MEKEKDANLSAEIKLFASMSDVDKIAAVKEELKSMRGCLKIIETALSSCDEMPDLHDIEGAISVVKNTTDLLLTKLSSWL